MDQTEDGIPEPVAELHAGRVWRRDEIVQWANLSGRKLVGPT